MKIKKTYKTDNVKKLNTIIKELKNKNIKIGIFGSDDSKILLIAKVNEYGLDINVTPKMRAWFHYKGLHLKDSTTNIHIPERSFIRKTYDEKRGEIEKIVKNGLEELFSFKIDINTFFNRVGTYLVGITQETLTNVTIPKNHPFTLQQKSPKTNPLINTGHLRESITFKIE
ncbi:hypothetical protein [Clostridium rectalis]|uniref:hypothetical protein n=1 Tax=Clostridium rectalis TaxID=2040295 RepID=UPI000F63DFE1|nr:hypothetical protein [Clostridium rectalis]